MITRQNYFDFAHKQNIVGRFPEFQEFHQFVYEATKGGKDWSPYDEEPDTRKFIDSYFHTLNSNKKYAGEVTAQQTHHSSPETPLRPQSNATGDKKRAGSTKKAKTPAGRSGSKKRGRKPGSGGKNKKQKKVLNLPKGKLVELVDPHLLFVGRFLRMNGQKRSRNALELFFSQINQAADARILRKASPYSDHILYIQKQLLKYLSGSGDEFAIEIHSGKFDELLRSVAKEQQMASVRLLKRYHNMAGRPTSVDKAKKLYNELYNAIENGKIPEKDRLFKRVTKVMRDLLDYVKADDTSASLVRLPAELGGVLGFMDGCLCSKDRQLNSLACPDDVRVKFGK